MTAKRPFAFGLVLVAGILVAFTAAAYADEVAAYQRALTEVCKTGVTPELNAQYQRAVASVDRDRAVVDTTTYLPDYSPAPGTPAPSKQSVRGTTDPRGRTTINFWGPRPPDLAWANCWQAR